MSVVRAKGQDARVTFVSPSGTEDMLNEGGMLSMDIVFKLKTMEEPMLGETANRLDDIYESTTFEMEGEVSRSSWFDFVKRVMDRSQRRTPAEAVFNVITSVQFATGDFGRVLLEDIKFGALPFNIGGRDEYIKIKVQGGASMPRFL